MLGTLGNTFKLLHISWQILKSDRELILLPLMSGAALFFVFLYTTAAFWAGGTLDRIGPDYAPRVADVVFLGLAYFMASFVIIYFNAVLVGSAYQRFEGFGADLRSGFNAANDRLGAIFGWSAIAATVALVLDQLSDTRSLLGKMMGFALRLLWGYATFFVVPVLIIEGASPMDALGRSTELFRQQWGKAMVANFGFGIGYVLVAIVALAPAAALYFGLGVLIPAVLVAAILLLFGFAMVKALEVIFTVALYDFAATGRISPEYSDQMIRGAYVDKSDKGRWRNQPMVNRAGW